MFHRNFASFICIFMVAVIATAHNDSHAVTASDLESTVYPLTTENPEYSTRGPAQQVTESTAVDLGALLDAGDGAVVTLVTGNTRLVAHTAVLTARSPVFAATLQRMTLEASTSEVAIPDVEGPVLRHLLAYMYTLQAPQLPSVASQLLVAADTYGLSALKAHCEQQVAAQLSVETAVTVAFLAVRHSCSSLKQAAVAFIRTHIFHVMATQAWADAMNREPADLRKVIQLLSDPPAEASVPATGGSWTTPTTQPHSAHCGHRGQTPTSAALPTTNLSTVPSDDVVSRLRSLSAKEKSRRLIIAAEEGAVEEVEALLAAGADPRARDREGNTALHRAANSGHLEVARRLLEAGALVNVSNRSHWTPLHFAATNGHAAMVWLLVEEASADTNVRDGYRRTPLHAAVLEGQTMAAAALLQSGADTGAKDNRHRTPLDIARQYNHQQLIDMLT